VAVVADITLKIPALTVVQAVEEGLPVQPAVQVPAVKDLLVVQLLQMQVVAVVAQAGQQLEQIVEMAALDCNLVLAAHQHTMQVVVVDQQVQALKALGVLVVVAPLEQ
jgi:hypothetical protein